MRETAIAGVCLVDLKQVSDDRGRLMELHRAGDGASLEPAQWNAFHTRAGILRGMQVHLVRTEYMVLFDGQASGGMYDLRPGSPTEGVGIRIDMRQPDACGLTIPTGVLHGFYFAEPSIHVHALSETWGPDDEHSCHYGDPELGIEWPVASPTVNERDATAGSVRELQAALGERLARLRTTAAP